MTDLPRIFVPEPLPEAALQPLRAIAEVIQGVQDRPCSTMELLEAAKCCAAFVITSRDSITREVIAAGPQLKVIAKTGAKPNNVDIAAARAQGTLVTWTPGANAVSVAEFSLSLAFALAKNLVGYQRHLAAGGWRQYDRLAMELQGRMASLIGFGAIGAEVARRLQAFGLTVMAHDPGIPGASMRRCGVTPASFEEAVAAADILFLHCELNERTRHMLDEQALRSMKPTAILINTARGALVDEAALQHALRDGWIAGAGLDVFGIEPLSPESPLLQLPNVLATPHVAAFTREAIERETRWAVEDTTAILSGRPPVHWQDH